MLFGLISGCAYIQLTPQIAPFEEKVLSGDGPEKALLIDIHGVIHNQEQRSLAGFPLELGMVERVREILDQAAKDNSLRVLILRVNSPGGTVTSSDILFHEFKSFKEKRKVKIYVTVVDMAASGAYYLALAADRIMGHPTSLVGSIGVIALKVNLKDLMGNVGVDVEVVKSGDKKDFMSPLRPLTPEERRLFQETIDHFHNRFVGLVAENRPQIGLDKVKKLADGRIYTADQALENGLIDQIGYLDDAINGIKEDLHLPSLQVVTYQRPGEYKPNIYSSLPGNLPINLVNIDLGLHLDRTSPNFLYMWLP